MENRRRDPPLSLEIVRHFHEKPALITTADGAPIANGKLVVSEGDAHEEAPRVNLEFVARTVNFVLPIPPAQLFRFASTWTGSHYVYALPPGEQLWLQPPIDA